MPTVYVISSERQLCAGEYYDTVVIIVVHACLWVYEGVFCMLVSLRV